MSTVEMTGWSSRLDDLVMQIGHRFGRVEPRRRARSYVVGLLAPLADKNAWTIAEATGDSRPDGMQRLLNAARWDAGGVAQDLRGYVAEHLGTPRRSADP